MAHVRVSLKSVFLGAAFVLASIAAASYSVVAFAAAAPATAGKMTATLKALSDALSARDKAKIAALYADDATIEDPAESPLKVGRAAIDAFYGNAVDRGITIEFVQVDELPDRKCGAQVKVHVGSRVVQTMEEYSFKADGKIASMKSTPPARPQ